jgi:hypothetical protein
VPGLDELEKRLRESSEFRETIGCDVGTYAVALLGVFDERGGERLRLCGSGTLVNEEDHHYILTAAHVWEVLQRSRQVGITAKENLDHRFLIETGAMVASSTEKPAMWGEWGPDLAYLLLPAGYVGQIEAHQGCFYNLVRRRQDAPDCDHIETWLLLGTPAALGDFTPTHADFYMVGHYSRVESRHQRGEFDYLDLDVDTSLPGVPQNFGGLSGGGLWRVRIWSSSCGDRVEWLPSLEGVAFYQFPPVGDRRVVRCHGQESIRATVPRRNPQA